MSLPQRDSPPKYSAVFGCGAGRRVGPTHSADGINGRLPNSLSGAIGGTDGLLRAGQYQPRHSTRYCLLALESHRPPRPLNNNVLLIGAGSIYRAKVTDFGMSKLTELNPRMTGLTKCPDTPAYMLPKALLDPPVYTEKLDCFQVGVLMLQTMTRMFPNPGQAINRV